MPVFVTGAIFDEAKREALRRKKMKEIQHVKLEKNAGGVCVQILHIGPYEEEYRSLQKIEQYMKENNLVKNGPHHEIYLSDPRRTSPEKLRTIPRQPVRKRDMNYVPQS